MAADNENEILYWNNGGTLFRCSFADLRNGNLGGITSLTMTQQNGTTTSVNFVALAYDQVSNRLLGTRNIAIEAVHEINTTTGFSAPIYTYSSTFDFGGLDVDDSSGVLYGLSDTGPAGIYSIDVTGLTQTFLSAYPNNPSTNLPETDIDGMAAGNGKIYLVTDGNITSQPVFYIYDIATASYTGTIPSVFTGAGTFSAAAFAPTLMSNQAVSGTLTLGDTVGTFAANRSISYVVKQGATTIGSGSITCSTASTTFSINLPASATGASTIELDGSSFLRRISNVNLTGSNQSVGTITLQNGDADNSGEVDAVDIDLVIADFGSVAVAATDADVSGEVDAADIDIVIANFGGVND